MLTTDFVTVPTTPNALHQAHLSTSSILITCGLPWAEEYALWLAVPPVRRGVWAAGEPHALYLKLEHFFYLLERLVRPGWYAKVPGPPLLVLMGHHQAFVRSFALERAGG